MRPIQRARTGPSPTGACPRSRCDFTAIRYRKPKMESPAAAGCFPRGPRLSLCRNALYRRHCGRALKVLCAHFGCICVVATVVSPVVQAVREKFACRDCETISQAPAPFHVTLRGGAPGSMCATTRRSGGTGPPTALFHYARDRSGVHPEEHLQGFAGILQANAYAGYSRLTEPGRSPRLCAGATRGANSLSWPTSRRKRRRANKAPSSRRWPSRR